MGQKLFPCFTLCLIVSLSTTIYRYPLVYSQQLDYNFYAKSCPGLPWIVSKGVQSAVNNDYRMAASLLRLHFHDCIVNGCDASVLLDATKDFTGEKNAPANRNSLRGFEVIDNIKAEVERYCPLIVSCADILTLAAKEAVSMAGGVYSSWPGPIGPRDGPREKAAGWGYDKGNNFWLVPLGRRDGTTASEDAVNEQIPSPFEPLQNITAKFTSKGLDLKDVVVLSGGHTIGYAQCFAFKRRLFDYQGSGKPDPTLDSSLLSNLQSTCPNRDASKTNLAPLDVTSSDKFDNSYYTNLKSNKVLLESDQALMGDPQAAAMVESYSMNPLLFYTDFVASMIKLGNVGVLTGQNGEIRKKCGSVN